MSTNTGCSCATRPKNTGRPNCVEQRGVSNGAVIALYRDQDGNVNGIPDGTVINSTYVQGKLTNADYFLKWYVLPRNYRVVSERAEDKTEDVEGVLKRTGERGVRLRTFELLGKDATTEMLQALESMQCRTLGFFDLTKKRQICGTNIGDGDLLLTKIEEDTFMVRPVYATDGVLQKIMVSFVIDETELDSDQDFIPSSDIVYGVQNWYNDQPIEAHIVEVDSTQLDELVVDLKWMWNNNAQEQLTGFTDVADWALYNVTDSLAITILTVTESSTISGRYTLTFAAQTDQDYGRVDITKTGYESEYTFFYFGTPS